MLPIIDFEDFDEEALLDVFIELDLNLSLDLTENEFIQTSLSNFLEENALGSLDGFRTDHQLGEYGLHRCAVSFVLDELDDQSLGQIIGFISYFGVPKGSVLVVDDSEGLEIPEIPVGTLEGLCLSIEASQDYDAGLEAEVSALVQQAEQALGEDFRLMTSTLDADRLNIVIFSPSFAKASAVMQALVADSPLFDRSEILQVF